MCVCERVCECVHVCVGHWDWLLHTQLVGMPPLHGMVDMNRVSKIQVEISLPAVPC